MNGKSIRRQIVPLICLVTITEVYTQENEDSTISNLQQIFQNNSVMIYTTDPTPFNNVSADNYGNKTSSTTDSTNLLIISPHKTIGENSSSSILPDQTTSKLNLVVPAESHLIESPVYFAIGSVLFATSIMTILLVIGYTIYRRYDATVPYAMCYLIRPRNPGNDLVGLI